MKELSVKEFAKALLSKIEDYSYEIEDCDENNCDTYTYAEVIEVHDLRKLIEKLLK